MFVLQRQGSILLIPRSMLRYRTRLSRPSPFSGPLLTATAPCQLRATLWRGGRLAIRPGRGAMLEKPLHQQRSPSAVLLKKLATNSASPPWMTLDRVHIWKYLEASTWVTLVEALVVSVFKSLSHPFFFFFFDRAPRRRHKRPDKQRCSRWWRVLHFCGAVCCMFWLLVP